MKHPSALHHCILAGTLALFFLIAPAQAATTVYVTTNVDRDNGSCQVGDCSLREAVNYSSAGAYIELQYSGIYTLVSRLLVNRSMTIAGHEWDTPISGGNATRLFRVTAGTVTIKDMVMTAGSTNLDPGGGAIENLTTLSLDNVLIYNCTATARPGGGIYNSGQLTITDSTFSGNTAGTYGGAVHSYGAAATATLEDTVVQSNHANVGGGVSSEEGGLTLTRCRLELNESTSTSGGGGAVRMQNGTAAITDCAFDSNNAYASGGAIWASSVDPLSLTGCTFQDNTCDGAGGGLYLSANALDFKNCTITGNSAKGHGGGAWLRGTSGAYTNLSFLTITGNTADSDCGSGGTCDNGDGGGIYLDMYGFRMKGVIVAGNSDNTTAGGWIRPDICKSVSASFGAHSCNLVGNNASCVTDLPEGLPNGNNEYVGNTSSPLDPLLWALADNGGPTQTRAPARASLAVNRGPADCTCADGTVVATDQTGGPRARGCPDIGAYELPVGSCAPLAVLMD